MKKLMIFLTTVFLFGSAQAHGDLTESMKSMGEQFKTIATGIQKKDLTQVEYEACERMQRDAAAAAQIYPHTATTDELKLKYAGWMAELMQMTLQLEDAMEVTMTSDPQDVTEVLKIFRSMNELRKEAHTLLKEE